eukprot:1852149-Prymnesium_polylepis.1
MIRSRDGRMLRASHGQKSSHSVPAQTGCQPPLASMGDLLIVPAHTPPIVPHPLLCPAAAPPAAPPHTPH